MEQLIFIAIFVVISIVNAIMKKRAQAREEEEMRRAQFDEPAEPAFPSSRRVETQRPTTLDSDEERTRKFLEALGLPTSAPVPPPRVAPQQRRIPEEPPVTPPPLPEVRATRRAKPARQAEVVPEFRHQPSTPDLSVAEKAALDRIRSGGGGIGGRRESRARNRVDPKTLLGQLHDRDALRRAFVLREILDEPPGLKSQWGVHNV